MFFFPFSMCVELDTLLFRGLESALGSGPWIDFFNTVMDRREGLLWVSS